MEKRFLFPNSLDSSFKLTKSASFSELTTSKKVVIEHHFQSGEHGNLIKQYSCEEFHDQRSNESHLSFSQTIKSNNKEHTNVWKSTVPSYNTFNHLDLMQSQDKPMYLQKSPSLPSGDRHPKKDGTSKNILSSPKLILNNNAMEQKPLFNTKIEMFNAEALPSIGNISDSEFMFKKPLPILKKTISKKEESEEEDSSDDPSKESNSERGEKKLDTTELKRRLRSLVKIDESKRRKSHFHQSFIFYILVAMVVLYLAFIFNGINSSSKLCDPRFETDAVPQKLREKIYDQDSAVNDLSKVFTEINNKSSFNVVALVGGIGVGKSYTSEIINKAMKESSKTLDFFPPLFRKERQAYTSLSACRCNLIRLENLKTDDIEEAATFIRNLKILAGNYCILTLTIINPQETDDFLRKTLDLDKSVSMVDEKFGEAGLKPVVVKYKRMNDEALVKCIKKAADYANVILSDEDVQYVMRDLVAGDSGCKGAYAKVQLVGRAAQS